MFTFSDILHISRLVEPTPPLLHSWPWWAGSFGLAIVLGVVIHLRYRNTKSRALGRLRSALFNSFVISGILGLVELFFRAQNLPYLSARLLVVATIAVAIIWIIIAAIIGMRTIPVEQRALKNAVLQEKYLPRARQKR